MKFPNRIFVLTAMFATAIALFYACSKDVKEKNSPVSSVSASTSTNVVDASGNSITTCGTPQVDPLTAGQTIPAGSVIIENDENNVYVTYQTSGDWKLQEVHLSVDCNTNGDCTQAKSSDLAPGKFPYKMIFNAGTSGFCAADGLPVTYTFTIPKTALGSCTCFCVYPHAVVVRCSSGSVAETQTAWGGYVSRITNGKWYGGTNYCLQQCGDL
ncbi:MAG: hypothetical protein ABIO05_00080, partial [Ferruginibacter sp.]